MQRIYVLEHEHKYWMDLSAHRTKCGAERAAAAIIEDLVSGCDRSDFAAAVRELLAKRDYKALLALWNGRRGGDEYGAYLRVRELTVHD